MRGMVMNCDFESLPVFVGVLSSAIAKNFNANELAVLSGVFTQLGDSLALVAVQRAMQEQCKHIEENRKNDVFS